MLTFFVGLLITMSQLSSELGDFSCLPQAIKLLRPVHVAVPLAVIRLIR
jgi:hypothetical protein